MDTSANSRDSKKIATADQESWIIARIHTAIDMSIRLIRAKKVGADDLLMQHGINGIINGAAVEIIKHLDMEPEYTALRTKCKMI